MSDRRPIFRGVEKVYFVAASVLSGLLAFAVDWSVWAAGALAVAIYASAAFVDRQVRARLAGRGSRTAVD